MPLTPGVGSRVAIDLRGMFAKLGIESDKAEIRRDDIRTVAGSSDVYRANIYDLVIRPRNDTLRRAKKRLGEKGYNILSKNCQHFCTEARYGIAMNMEEELYLGLRTGHYYRAGRVLVNTVLLPDMQAQHFRKPDVLLLVKIWSVSKKCLPLALYIPTDEPRFLKTSQRHPTTERSECSRDNMNFDEERLKIFSSESRYINDNCTLDVQNPAKVENISLPDICAGYGNFKCITQNSPDSNSNRLMYNCKEINIPSESDLSLFTRNITSSTSLGTMSSVSEDISLPDICGGHKGIAFYYGNSHYSTDSHSKRQLYNCPRIAIPSESDVNMHKRKSISDTLSSLPKDILFSDDICIGYEGIADYGTMSNIISKADTKWSKKHQRCLSMLDFCNGVNVIDDKISTTQISFDPSSSCSNMLFNFCSANKPLNCSYQSISHYNSSAEICVIL